MKDTNKSIPASNAALSLLATWARQGAESFAATQKILLDLAAQQNSLALGFVRERMSSLPIGPVSGLVEFAAQGAANFIAAQQILLDLAVQQNAIVHQGVKDGLGLTGQAAAMADAVHGGVDAFVAMQKRFLDMAAEEGVTVVQSVMAGSPGSRRESGGEGSRRPADLRRNAAALSQSGRRTGFSKAR